MLNIEIGGSPIGLGHPTIVVAELSANWKDLQTARSAVNLTKQIGANALKSQCYSSDTIAVQKDLIINKGEWKGQSYRELYQRAAMPREWNIELADEAKRVGVGFFSTPFSEYDADWLEEHIDPICYKIASFEIVDLPLIQHTAQFGKPIIISTGMAHFGEVDRAVAILEQANVPFALLLCNSNYPAQEEEIDIRRMQELSIFNCPIGFSDHTTGTYAAIVAVALGANIIEKHFTPDVYYTPDSAFSLGTTSFKSMVNAIRQTEDMLKPRELNRDNLMFRPSLWVTQDIKAGEKFTPDNVKSLRPNLGMEIRKYWNVLESVATTDISANTPLTRDMVA